MISFRQVLCVGLLALLTASPAIAEVRTWTDSTGKFSVKAEFIEVSNGKAVLKRADSGKEVRLPLVRLSKSDQLLIRQILAERRKQAKEAKESEDSDDANRAARRADDADATEPSDDPVAEEEPEDKEVVENKPAVAVKPPAVEPPTRPAPRIALPERRPPNNVINSVRGAVYRTQTLNNLKQLGVALMSYESARGRYPTSAIYTPEGKPGLSWRVALLPYLEEQGLYRQFHLNEPWDSPHNRELARQMPAVFKSPGSDLDDGYTNYLAVV
ncbi:MAG: DUF1559 domain-containing protein, partial [Planctomycetales bacterium]|nr:DUF1559 domain-containing protein [Planctomycetales bacterium]